MMLIDSKSGKKKQIWGKWKQNTNSGKKNSRVCLGTGNALFSYFDQFLYFDHNLLISDPI